jgi:hypothetical protein
MAVTIEVDAAGAVEHLGEIDARTRQQLVDRLGPLAQKVAADARANAAAHIHLLGSKPGRFVDSIHGELIEDGSSVVARVGSSHPLSHLLEYGAARAAHEILPDVAGALHFFLGAGEVFAGGVQAPASASPAFHDIGRALEANLPDIRQAIIEATAINDDSGIGGIDMSRIGGGVDVASVVTALAHIGAAFLPAPATHAHGPRQIGHASSPARITNGGGHGR